MERHLNVFYSYSQGSSRDIREERTLEDNVTRALMITLCSSQALTRQFLSKFLGVQSSGGYEYGLQTTWQEFSKEPEQAKRLQSSFVLGIAPEITKVSGTRIPEPLLRKIESIISAKGAGRKKLQDLLSELGTERKEKPVESASLVNRLETLLDRDTATHVRQLSESDLRYLYDLTLGSRPDALILDRSGGLVVLIENKIHGDIVGVQIERHIRENFGEEKERTPLRVCSWRRDVYSFFKSFQEEAECHHNPKVSFLVEQFLEYLEVIGMGEIKFARDDFLKWESYDDLDYVHTLHDRVESLGNTLAAHLGAHWVNRQKSHRNYLGVNIVHDNYKRKGIQPVNVPHWSLAIQQHGAENRCLRLFIQCESKELGKLLLRNSGELQDRLSAALRKVAGNPGIVLRIMEKSHLIQGGKGKNEGVWATYLSFPLELYGSPQDVRQMVAQALKGMALLYGPQVQEERMKNWVDMPKFKGKTIVGVLQLNYQLNWLELEKLGIGPSSTLADKLKDVTDRLRPYYDVLRDYVQ